MNLTGLLPVLLDDPAAGQVVELAREPLAAARASAVDVVLPPGARPALLAAVCDALGAPGGSRPPVVVVTATGRDAEDLAASLRCYLPGDDVAVLPAWETLPHERLSPRSDTVARRLAVFRRLGHPVPDGGQAGPVRLLVLPVRALLQPIVAGLEDLEPVAVQTGDQVDLDELSERLVAAA